MNFDGGRVKIEVRETLFCVFAGNFHRLCRAYILQRLWVQLFSNQDPAYLENFFEFTFNTPRPAWNDVYWQKSTRECFKYYIISRICCIFLRGSMVWKITWRAGSPGSSFNSTYFFFGCFCLFVFCFFLLLVCFSLILLLALRLSFTRCCDIRISELFVWSGVTRYG